MGQSKLAEKLAAIGGRISDRKRQMEVLKAEDEADYRLISELVGESAEETVRAPSRSNKKSVVSPAEAVLGYMSKRPDAKVKTADITKALGLSSKRTSNAITYLLSKKKVTRVDTGVYKFHKPRSQRLIKNPLTLNIIKIVERDKKVSTQDVVRETKADSKRVAQILLRMAQRGVAQKLGPSEYAHKPKFTNGMN